MAHQNIAPEKWDESADVIVIGSGYAGMAAACEARKLGASVLILEKMPYIGGNSVISGGGYCCWDSRLKLREKLNLGDDSPEHHLEDTLRGGGYYNDPALVEVLVHQAPDGLNWLIDAGAVFSETLHRLGGHSAYRSYQAACNLAEVVKKRAIALGAELRLSTTVTALHLDRNGRASSVSVIKEGAVKNIAARRGVVIASGGFGNDIKLRTTYRPALGDAYNTTNHKGATGELIELAQAVGAAICHMDFIQLYPCAEPQKGRIDMFALDCYSGPGYGLIYVNRHGHRFVSELAGRDTVADAQLTAGDRPTYAILNAAIFRRLNRSDQALSKAIGAKRLYKAETLTQLAAQLQIPTKTLTETAERHNDALRCGIDTDFNKPITDQMLPLSEGPFYAIAQWPSIHYTMGGLRINVNAQVLNKNGAPIQGLYAAGEVCGGIHGNNRLGGNAIAECIVFGRIAGKNAAAGCTPTD